MRKTYLTKLFFSVLCVLCLLNSTLAQTTIFSENIGIPTGTTTIAAYTGWQNNGVLTFNNGGATLPADVRITSVSSTYAGASAAGNVFFTSTSGSYGLGIDGINASTFSNLVLQFGYRKESASLLATFSVEYWDGSAWVVVANTAATLFNEAANASTGWYLSKAISLPVGAQINGLKIRFVKSGTASIRIDDIRLTGTAAASSNANLSNLILSNGTLTPVFTQATISYTASVANAVNAITVTPTAADAGATITVNGNAVTSGSPSGAIALNVGSNIITTIVTAADLTTTKTYTVDVTRLAAGTPAISLTNPLADFGNVCINTTTAANSFILDGSDLDGSNSSTINIAALPGFSYCETVGGTYTSTLSFTYTGSGFTGKNIYVKFNPLAVQLYNGNIVVSGGGVAGINVAATGAGVNTATVVTTNAATTITASTASLPGTISTPGCSNVIAYGIEYSLTSGFPNGTGTQIPASNLAAGNFSTNLTGQAPNSRVYFKAYVTDGNGTTYGAQQAFNLNPLAIPMLSQSNLTFTETFADIVNWDNFFINGTGANHWDGLSTNGTTPIPSAPILTTQTNTFQTPSSPGANVAGGGVQKGTDQLPAPGTQSIVLLSTGTTNNTTSAGIDIWVDFTGVNAGILSFDYTTIQNNLLGAGDNRPGSLRVYGSPDRGVTFTELTNVLNFTNNLVLSGSKTNVPLPASFNNNANTLIRFYYYNGETGGTTGSRPKIAIDNVKITAIATTPCVAPTAPATNLTFGTITDVAIAGSFTAASPACDGYIVVMSTSSSLNGAPVNGQIYNAGDNIGDGTVIANSNATSFTATGLTALTTYYFFVFSVNGICTGGPLYYTTTVLNGTASTIAGLPPCAAPAGQPTGLVFGTTTTIAVQGSFTATAADEYVVVRSTAATLSAPPVNGTIYNTGDALGGGVVVQRSAATSFTATGLAPNTTYYFFIFAINSAACVNGPAYNTVNPLTASQSTQPLPPCAAPLSQPTSLNLAATNTAISGTFTAVTDADNYLVIQSTSATLGAIPADNTNYNVGTAFGSGVVIANTGNTSFVATGLTPGTTYYFFVFAANSICSGGTKYAAGAPLSGNIATNNTPLNNYYFGTLHSHSDYSDGNKDQPGFTPADDYAYAKNSLCMDFLGISDHNHFSNGDPGSLAANYHLGSSQANTFTSSNPGFVAMYGMEWGTISGGGHVLIYGDGMDDLWGWESGSGPWGASNNYDVYVPKSVYTSSTGLFKTVNDNIATNTFASLAHPGLSDFNNLATIAYDAAADDAITAVSVESGPAPSTNTTYSNPGSSMSTLWYYQLLLSKGYHLGPTIDHDNHYTTFGRTTYSRTAIVATVNTKTALTAAIRNMNFYATQDCDTKVDFTVNARIMGGIFTDRFAPNIAVTLTDATTSTAGAVIRVMHGVPGNGVLPVKIDSAIGSSLNFTHTALANLATGYYYLDITNGTSRIVTAPIWYTRDDNFGVLPVRLASFEVTKLDNVAKITWATELEINSSHFVIERSTNGNSWNTIATVAAKGNSTVKVNYETYDNAPVRGINYYRLRQVDKNGQFELSAVRNALFNARNTVEIAPNPATNYINLYIGKTAARQTPATVQLLNAAGKVVYSILSVQSHIQIPTAALAKGLYFAKVITADGPTTLRVVVE
jgi:hypothetical protein